MFGNSGFNSPCPPINFPGNTPNMNIGDPRLYQGFGMTPPSFPTYTSAPDHNDVYFVENPNLDGNGLWLGQFEATDTTKNAQPYINPENRNQTCVLVELPKEVEKVPNAYNNPEPKKENSDWKTTKKAKRAAFWRETKLYVDHPELHKKLKTEEIAHPPEKPEIVINNKWRSDPSNMYSCDLCQYHTPDKNLMERHLYCYRHNVILQHLCDFFPRQKVEVLQDYLICKKNKMLIENKKHNIEPVKDKLEGIGERQFVHRIQAAHCQACDVLIPDVEKLLREHVESDAHYQNCQATLSKIKHYSPVIAAEILEELNMGQKLFKVVRSIQVSITNEVLVADEEHNDDSNDKDTIEDARDDPEFPVTHSESPAHETKDFYNKRFLPDEPEKNEPATSSMIATSCCTKCNSPAVAPDYFGDEYISQILKKYRMGQDPFKDVAVQPPHVSSTNEVLVAEEDDDDTNDEDTIDDARDDPEDPDTHNESPAHETKETDNKMFLTHEPEMNEPATSSMTVNPGGIVEEEEEEEEEAAEAP